MIEASQDINESVIFDRAMPDSMAYYKIADLNPEDIRLECEKFRYKMVFLFEHLHLAQDGVRTEDEHQQIKIETSLAEVYDSLGYEVIRLPRFSNDRETSLKMRVDFIEQKISSKIKFLSNPTSGPEL